jgi:hypothetical protein
MSTRPAPDDLPEVFQAEARIEPSRFLRRPRRVLHYDAAWPDGRIVTDVHPTALMYRRAPADYAVVKRVLDEHCPEVGIGPWVEYPTGRLIGATPDA